MRFRHVYVMYTVKVSFVHLYTFGECFHLDEIHRLFSLPFALFDIFNLKYIEFYHKHAFEI